MIGQSGARAVLHVELVRGHGFDKSFSIHHVAMAAIVQDYLKCHGVVVPETATGLTLIGRGASSQGSIKHTLQNYIFHTNLNTKYYFFFLYLMFFG